jgi:hypothetical protein
VIARHNITRADIPSVFDAMFNDELRAALRHGMRPVRWVGFDAPADTRDEARKQSDAALLTVIRRKRGAGP